MLLQKRNNGEKSPWTQAQRAIGWDDGPSARRGLDAPDCCAVGCADSGPIILGKKVLCLRDMLSIPC